MSCACSYGTIWCLLCVDNFAIVHDSFGVLAADAPTMLRTLRDVVADVFAVDRLKDFRDEMQRQLPEGIVLPDLPEYGSLDVEVARGAQYLFS